MKRKYEKPMAFVEAFVADEYVAACYYLACDVGDKKDWWGRQQYNYSNGNQWNGTEYGGVYHAKVGTSGTCADASANRVITDHGGLLSGAQVGEYNKDQGWINGGIDSWSDNNGSKKIDAGDTIYWHTFDKNKDRRWNHKGILTSGSNANHS